MVFLHLDFFWVTLALYFFHSRSKEEVVRCRSGLPLMVLDE